MGVIEIGDGTVVVEGFDGSKAPGSFEDTEKVSFVASFVTFAVFSALCIELVAFCKTL